MKQRAASLARLVLVTLAALAALPAVAVSQGTAQDIEPVVGSGLISTEGVFLGVPYTGTLSTSFSPSQIQPGESFFFTSHMQIENGIALEDCGGGTGPANWGFFKVEPGTTPWTDTVPGDDRALPGTILDVCREGGQDYAATFFVPGLYSAGMETGCYQGTSVNWHLWFPGSVANSGTLSTLTVGNSSCVDDCHDGQNNDFDGLIDLLDPGCAADSTELGDVECDNGQDDDGDGTTDWPLDQTGCDDVVDDSEAGAQCQDGQPNDDDARNDYPTDPGCDSEEDDSEAPDPDCGDLKTNDKDALIDTADPGCLHIRDTSEYDEVTLTVDVLGPGWLHGCRETCSSKHERGVDVTMNAVPDEPNDGFLRFEGCGALGLSCAVKMDADRTVRAVFDPVVSYAPHITFSNGERRWPMDPAKFIARSSLRWRNDGGTGSRACTDDTKTWVARGEVKAAWLGNGKYKYPFCYLSFHGGGKTQQHHKTYTSKQLTSPSIKKKAGWLGRSGFYLDLSNDKKPTHWRAGVKPTGGANDPPLYVEYEPGRYIIYWFFSGQNDVTETFKYCSPCLPIPIIRKTEVRDKHEGDWEHIVVRLNGRDQVPEKKADSPFEHDAIGYWAHYCGPTLYTWYFMENQGYTTGESHPRVWIAKGSHASYPNEGHDWVAGGCKSPLKGLNDTRTKGHVWKTWEHGRDGFKEADKQPWYGFGGGWGSLADSNKRFPGPFWGPLGPGKLKMKEALPQGW